MKKYLIIITISLFIIAGSNFAFHKWGFQKGKSSVKCPERIPISNTIIIDNKTIDSLTKINETLKKQIDEKPKIQIRYMHNACKHDSSNVIHNDTIVYLGIFREWSNYLAI